jgi:hypothetical protein
MHPLVRFLSFYERISGPVQLAACAAIPKRLVRRTRPTFGIDETKFSLCYLLLAGP